MLRLLIVGGRLVFLSFLECFPVVLQFPQHFNHGNHKVTLYVLIQSLNHQIIVIQKQLHFVVPKLFNELLLQAS